jgi:hypothetical protein
MANARYPVTDDLFLTGGINMLTDTINVSALTNAYTYSAAHAFRSQLAGVVFTATLTGKTVDLGVFDCDDVIEPAVTAGSTIERLVIWKDTGSNATSPLIRYFDQFSSGAPISLLTNNAAVTIVWPDVSTRVFRL